MKTTINRKTLLRELGLLVLVTERKARLPVLQCVKIDADNGGVTLSATNLDQWLTSTVEAAVAEAGACLINARLLLDIVKAATSKEIGLTLTPEGLLTVTADKSEWTLGTHNLDVYPESPEVPARKALTLPFATFRNGLKSVAFALVEGQSRYALSAVKLVINKDMQMVATDGHRLALFTEPNVKGNVDVLFPKAALRTLARFPDTKDVHIHVTPGEGPNNQRRMYLEIDDRLWTVNLTDGNFPDYNTVLPKAFDMTVKFDAVAMAQACKQALPTANRHASIAWGLQKGGIAEISAKDVSLGTFKTEIVTTYRGRGEWSCGVNARFLLDVCKWGGVIAMTTLKAPDSVLSFTSGQMRCVIMPLRHGT